MTTTTAPTRPPAPKAPPVPPAAGRKIIQFAQVKQAAGHRVVLYGPGGIGKTTLASQAPGPVAFFDLDDSLSRLQIGGDIAVIHVSDWVGILAALRSDGWDRIKTIVIDTGTRAEELAVAHTLLNVMQDGKKFSNIEGYGFGKGFGYVFDTFLPILAELDRHAADGRHIISICHDCTTTVPNPSGEDWLRYEPRLQSPNSGKASIRLRVREWADHVLFIGYDVAVDKEGKGQGCGTRTIYPVELPHCMAKNRRGMSAPYPLTAENGQEFWSMLLG